MGLAILALSACAATNGRSGEGSAAAPAANVAVAPPATFDVTGAMSVVPDYERLWQEAGGGFEAKVDGRPCHGAAGLSDISVGAQVTVRNGDDKVIAIGQLGDGVARTVDRTSKSGAAICSFSLAVSGVPEGSSFYSVEVAHRGPVQFTSAAMRRPLILVVK